MIVDLKKAFDTVNHGIRINKLDYYGIIGKHLDLLISYLTTDSDSYIIMKVNLLYIYIYISSIIDNIYKYSRFRNLFRYLENITYYSKKVTLLNQQIIGPLAFYLACSLFLIISINLTFYLRLNNYINKCLYIFLAGKSTELQLISFYNKIYEAIDTFLISDITYIDLAKAFDKVSHSKLLH